MSFDVNLLVTVIGSRYRAAAWPFYRYTLPAFFDFVWRRPACLIRIARIERTDVLLAARTKWRAALHGGMDRLTSMKFIIALLVQEVKRYVVTD
jgi:hypothetical protein